ncbi:hypothetical protein EDB80DRAFT_685865 [Ilyonectria destructans]|nr:hypothetical protein EDB80DRAFT_685865 [Ilyonectria destructans]
MSSPILGDSPSLHGRLENEQINLKHIPLEEHNTSFPMNTPADPNPVAPSDGDNTGYIVRAQGSGCHHQPPRRDDSEKRWGPEFFPNGEDPGTPTEMNSPTRYEDFASAPQPDPLREPSHGTSPTQKRGGRHNAKEPARIKKKRVKRPKRDDNTLGTASGRPVPPGIQRGLELFQEQLGLLEEQNKRRLEASQGEPSEKSI